MVGEECIDKSKTMKIHFEEGISNMYNEDEVERFYNKMKRIIVVVDAELANGEHNISTGAYINEKGYILTSSQMVPETIIGLRIEDYKGDFKTAIVDRRNEKHNLVLIKTEGDNMPSFDGHVEFGDDKFIKFGRNAFMIAHSNQQFYTNHVGQISYPSRILKNCIVLEKEHPLERCDEEMKLIQFNNLHGDKCSHGAPVFDRNGRMMGMFTQRSKFKAFAVHFDAVKNFIDNA